MKVVPDCGADAAIFVVAADATAVGVYSALFSRIKHFAK
jgi:hypothetical protein